MSAAGMIISVICLSALCLAVFYWITIPFAMVSLASEKAQVTLGDAGKLYDGFNATYNCFDRRVESIDRYYRRSILCVFVFFGCFLYYSYRTRSLSAFLFSVIPLGCFTACLLYNKKNRRWPDERLNFLDSCAYDMGRIADVERLRAMSYTEQDVETEKIMNIMRNATNTLDEFFHISLVTIGATSAFAISAIAFVAFSMPD